LAAGRLFEAAAGRTGELGLRRESREADDADRLLSGAVSVILRSW
jgi:hypothetical protein